MSKARRKKSPNTDLVKAVQHRTEDILDFYEEIEDDRPVIVLDYQKQTINAYHYEEYKATLSVESQEILGIDAVSQFFPSAVRGAGHVFVSAYKARM